MLDLQPAATSISTLSIRVLSSNLAWTKTRRGAVRSGVRRIKQLICRRSLADAVREGFGGRVVWEKRVLFANLGSPGK